MVVPAKIRVIAEKTRDSGTCISTNCGGTQIPKEWPHQGLSQEPLLRKDSALFPEAASISLRSRLDARKHGNSKTPSLRWGGVEPRITAETDGYSNLITTECWLGLTECWFGLTAMQARSLCATYEAYQLVGGKEVAQTWLTYALPQA